VIPTGKTHIKIVIEDSFGNKADVHTYAIVVKETPIKFLIGNNVNIRLGIVIDFKSKTTRFGADNNGVVTLVCK
jgi:hypothetical protein